jgi:hypothetical protein
MKKLYCTTVRVVDLVWADSEHEAVSILGRNILGAGRLADDIDILDGEAFVSEPVESEGWAGEPDSA